VEPYVVRRGDFLLKLAYQFGFDADTVWNDEKNAQLRQLRPDPNILYPSDILYIPDQTYKQPVMQDLTAGTTNTFVTDPPTVLVSFTFSDSNCALQAFTVPELPQLTGLSTGADGSVSFSVPVTIDAFTLEFTDLGLTVPCGLGYFDPINTLSGIFQRLQNLGYIYIGAAFPPDVEVVRTALRNFRAAQPGGAEAAAPADPSPSGGASSDAPDSPSSTDADPSVSASDGSPLPSSGGSPGFQDDAGLSDDGTLDDETSKLLLAAYGF
jgi:N-acetylmuramoyl-L-alanine amidase